MHMRSRSGLFVAAACLLTLSACGGGSSSSASKAPAADTWAVVDGREIKKDDVEKAYRRVSDLTAKPSDAEVLTAKLSILSEMITQDLLLAKAKALGVEVTGADIEKAFEERRKSVPDDVLQKQLTQRGLTTADVKEDIRRELTTQKLIEREVVQKVTVSDKAINDYFNANRAQFNLDEPGYRIAQIVVTPTQDQINNRQNDDATSPEAAARKVKMISDRLRGGGQFSELAMDYSEDPQSTPQGGDLGLIRQSQLAQAGGALRDAVMKAQPGTISQVSAGGAYSLVLLISKEPAGQRDLSTPGLRDDIANSLKERQQQLLQGAYLTTLRDNAKITNLLAKQVVDQSQATAPPAVAPAAPGKK